MKNTSHFIGITMRPEKFANIFIEINNLLWEDTKSIIEFQNMLSLHITLYYFPEKLSNIDLDTITKSISEIDLNKININFLWLQYFSEKIAYIWYKETLYLEQINSNFKKIFFNYNKIIDNSYDKFIPHTTIFKIKDYNLYLKYKEEIENIVIKNLEKINFKDTIEKISLYIVNSTFLPEIQIIIK